VIYTYSFGYSPSIVLIDKGDEIEWVNYDTGHDHTFTSDLPTSHPDYWNVLRHAFDIPYYKQFNHAGTFTFHDQLSSFTGSITVAGEPSVTITYPTNGAVFTAPANFYLTAVASNATDVEFYVDNTFLTRVDLIPPYPVSVSNLTAGNRQLMAIATDALGYQATNKVNITVTNPIIRLQNPRLVNGHFLFDATGLNTGRTNILQGSMDLKSWFPLQTNTSQAASQVLSNAVSSSWNFYRIMQ